MIIAIGAPKTTQASRSIIQVGNSLAAATAAADAGSGGGGRKGRIRYVRPIKGRLSERKVGRLT